jgi:hypothetical protein
MSAFFMGVNHGFQQYLPTDEKKAATLSWTRTIDFF